MIAYLTLAIAVCTIVLVLFMSFDVLRNRSVVDKTREDIDMIKKNLKELKHPVAYTMENYVIIPKSHLDEYNRQRESSSPVTARISRKYPPSPT